MENTVENTLKVDQNGYYGVFGGAFVPELLRPNLDELTKNYLRIMHEPSFQKEMHALLKNYVGRPTPLYFAQHLSEKYGAKIFLKREDLCHTGAHKINNAIGQTLLAKRMGKKNIIAETGAGQHGVAIATACALLGLSCTVFMGEKDMLRQKPNVERMRILGADVQAVSSGSKTLKDATNEAIRQWINQPEDTHYCIGSVVGPHPYPDLVSRLQSVISAEIKSQLLIETKRDYPDYIIACVGGGSNAAGAFYHFLDETRTKLIAVEAAGKGIHTQKSAATTKLGTEGILHGAYTLLMQDEDGQIQEPYSISAGLDYPGIGPLFAQLHTSGRAQFMHVDDEMALKGGIELSKMEGIIPAIETAHVFGCLEKLKFKPHESVVICLSGRGDKDLETYIKHASY